MRRRRRRHPRRRWWRGPRHGLRAAAAVPPALAACGGAVDGRCCGLIGSRAAEGGGTIGLPAAPGVPGGPLRRAASRQAHGSRTWRDPQARCRAGSVPPAASGGWPARGRVGHSGPSVCRRGSRWRIGMGRQRCAGSSRVGRRRPRTSRRCRARCGRRRRHGPSARRGPCPRWRSRRAAMGARNRQRVGLGQLGRRSSRWRGRAASARLVGVTGGAPGLAVGWTVALGDSAPCPAGSAARCMTASGTAAPPGWRGRQPPAPECPVRPLDLPHRGRWAAGRVDHRVDHRRIVDVPGR